MLRNFVVANGDDYQVMPGGLTRVAREKDDCIVSNQAGGISKDTWVLTRSQPTGNEEKPASRTTQPINNLIIDAVSEPLTSRAADNLFWVGRHLERTEAEARLLRTVLLKLREASEFNDATDSACLSVLLRALTHVTGTYPGFIKSGEQHLKNPEADLLALAKDNHRAGSLMTNIHNFSQSAFSIRDLWSQDTWRSIDAIQRRGQRSIQPVRECRTITESSGRPDYRNRRFYRPDYGKHDARSRLADAGQRTPTWNAHWR